MKKKLNIKKVLDFMFTVFLVCFFLSVIAGIWFGVPGFKFAATFFILAVIVIVVYISVKDLTNGAGKNI